MTDDPRRFRFAALILAAGVLLAGAVLIVPRLIGGSPPASPVRTDPSLAGSSAAPSLAEPAASSDQGGVQASGPGASATPRPTRSGPPRVRSLAPTEVYGFLPYWLLPTAQPDFERLTTLAYFGVGASADGSLQRVTKRGVVPAGWTGWTSDAMTQLIADAHKAGVRVALTIQRFSWNRKDAQKTAKLLGDPVARAALATDIVGEVKSRGADGVNLDFEPMTPELSSSFTDFVRELRAEMDATAPDMQLTFDFTSGLGGYDVGALTDDDAADAAILMAYDYRVGTAQTVGSISPLDSPDGHSVKASTELALAETSPDRLILGLPWYGRAWAATSPEADALVVHGRKHQVSEAVSYQNAIAAAQVQGRQYDEVGQSAWTVTPLSVCATCPPAWWQTWYDDVDSFAAKVDYALSNQMRGVAIWALGYEGDLPELWTVLDLALGGLQDSAPPTGQVDLDPAKVTGSHGSLPLVDGSAPLLLTADDGKDGSGVAFVRLSGSGELDGDQLAAGITYPMTETVDWSVVDPATGGSARPGQRVIYVQWRDVAGNWSEPESIKLWTKAGPPVVPGASPSPLPSGVPHPPPSGSPAPSGAGSSSPAASLPPAP